MSSVELTHSNLHAALAHAIDLAFDFDAQQGGPPPSDSSPVLMRFVDLLLTHQRREHEAWQRELERRNAVLNKYLARDMAAAYERYRHDPEFDTGGLETELVGILGDAGFQLTEGDIDKIVVPLNEVIEAGGPVEMAYLALSRINGRSPRTLRTDIAVAPEEPAGFPEPLRPSPSNRERVEWVAQLLEAQRPGR